jgi:hypothetical protein
VDGLIMGTFRIASNPGPDFDGHVRAGQFWPKAGRVARREEFSDEDWAALEADPRLHIADAADEAAAGAAAAEQSLREQVKAVIAGLGPSDFDDAGIPKLAAVKAALPEGTKGLTKAFLVTVWTDLKPPV